MHTVFVLVRILFCKIMTAMPVPSFLEKKAYWEEQMTQLL